MSTLYCLQVRPDPGVQVTGSATVACDSPRAAEIFGVVDTFGAQDDVPYPPRLREFAASACLLHFDSGLVSDQNGLVVTALLPSQAEFRRDSSTGSPSFGDRDVYCVLHAANGSRLESSRLVDPG